MAIIIGVGGKKNSGKDTACSIFNYIDYKGIEQANYHDWEVNKKKYEVHIAKRVVHFADPVKDCLSIIFGIDRRIFDDRFYKDEIWYDIRRGDFIKDECIGFQHRKLYIEDFTDLDSFRKLIGDSKNFPIIKIRTLMQVYATLMRNCFDENIWVTSTIKRADLIGRTLELGLVGDIRYINEAMAIKNVNNFSTGYVVRIIRDITNSIENSNHESERDIFTADYTIKNNSTIINLFYTCMEIYREIKEKNKKK